MKIKLSELKQIIREEANKGPHAAEKQLEAQKVQRGAAKKQMKVKNRFEDRAERFLSKLYPKLRKLIDPLEEEAEKILETLKDYKEDKDDVDGYNQLVRFLDHDIISHIHGTIDKVIPSSDEPDEKGFPYVSKK